MLSNIGKRLRGKGEATKESDILACDIVLFFFFAPIPIN